MQEELQCLYYYYYKYSISYVFTVTFIVIVRLDLDFFFFRGDRLTSCFCNETMGVKKNAPLYLSVIWRFVCPQLLFGKTLQIWIKMGGKCRYCPLKLEAPWFGVEMGNNPDWKLKWNLRIALCVSIWQSWSNIWLYFCQCCAFSFCIMTFSTYSLGRCHMMWQVQ